MAFHYSTQKTHFYSPTLESRLPDYPYAAPDRRPDQDGKLKYRYCSSERISQCSANGRLLTRLKFFHCAAAIKKLAELRMYMERGVQSLEGGLEYQI